MAGGTGDISFRILDNHNHKSIYHFTKILRQLYLISINQCLTKEPLRPNKWDSNNHVNCQLLRNLVYMWQCRRVTFS